MTLYRRLEGQSHEMRKRVLNAEKTIRDLFSSCFLLSFAPRFVFFRRLTRVSSAQSDRTEKFKTVLESSSNKKSDYTSVKEITT
jgi:hypothetical protein